MIRGAEALGARLERMKERLYRGAEETVAEAAQAVCAEAAARAPVETGRLRSSIHASAEGLTAAVRCNCPYGAAVELGTSRQSARPFLKRGKKVFAGRTDWRGIGEGFGRRWIFDFFGEECGDGAAQHRGGGLVFSSAELDSAAGGFMERESVPRAESG